METGFPGRSSNTGPDRNRPTARRPRVVVAPEAAIDWPEGKRIGGFPVEARWLRRVHLARADDDRYRPGTLLLLTVGTSNSAAHRWSKNSVRLLLEQETRKVPFDEIAELHLPAAGPVAPFDQLATLVPDGSGLVCRSKPATEVRRRFELAFGVVRRTGQARNLVSPSSRHGASSRSGRAPGNPRAPLLAPHEVPCGRRTGPHRSTSNTCRRMELGGADRNVHTLPMRCADMPFSWGFGVHAYSELAFDLPAAAQTFRTQYGLDRAVGGGR